MRVTFIMMMFQPLTFSASLKFLLSLFSHCLCRWRRLLSALNALAQMDVLLNLTEVTGEAKSQVSWTFNDLKFKHLGMDASLLMLA